MNGNYLLAIALGIGFVAGLRSFTAPAVVAWAANLGWLNLQDSRLAFMGSTAAVTILSLLALGELFADKVPGVPRRTSMSTSDRRLSSEWPINRCSPRACSEASAAWLAHSSAMKFPGNWSRSATSKTS